jgi:hypothetical protein
VWYQRKSVLDYAAALRIADAIDKEIWPKLTGLMGREPLLDLGSVRPFRGGDDRLDIALVEGYFYTIAYPPACEATPAFILLDR